jgi:hypothetical protein
MMMFGHKKIKTEEPRGVSSSELRELTEAVGRIEIALDELPNRLHRAVASAILEMPAAGPLVPLPKTTQKQPAPLVVDESRGGPIQVDSLKVWHPWTPEEDAILRDHPSAFASEVAKLLPGRTPGAVYERARTKHGRALKKAPSPKRKGKPSQSAPNRGKPYTKEQEAAMVAAATRAEIRSLARQYGRTEKGLRDYRGRLLQAKREAAAQASLGLIASPARERCEHDLILIGLHSEVLRLEIVMSPVAQTDFQVPLYRHTFGALIDHVNGAPMAIEDRLRKMKNEDLRKRALALLREPIPEPAPELCKAIIERMLKERPAVTP